MSLFQTEDTPCPSCGSNVPFEVVHSINVDRKPELRDQVLAGTFQQETCGTCGVTFRVEPQFTYLDIKRGQWIAAWPSSKLEAWPTWEEKASTSFAKAWGGKAPSSAQQVGGDLSPRTTFGWPALREKVVANDAGIDDGALELLKAGIYTTEDGAPIMSAELRLVDVIAESLVFGWFERGSELLSEAFSIDRTALAEVEAQRELWAPLRAEIGQGPYIDLQRTLVEGT